MGGYDSGKSIPRRTLRRNGNNIPVERFDIESIAVFKQMPSFIPDHFRSTRPVLEKCCLCMPLKKMEWCTPEAKQLGMRNILDCRSEKRTGFLSQLWPNEMYAINKPLFKPFPDIGPSLLSCPRVQSAIQETALQMMQESPSHSEAKIVKSLHSASVNTVKRMKASLSAVFIKLAAWWLTRFLSNMFTSIQVSRTQMMMLKEQCKKKIPIIYLPLHRSHMDYILVTLTLWNFDIRSPYVAAGENLDIPFFNWLMRGLGGFFIRRRLDCRRGQKDILYRAILQQYMSEILKHSEAMEFFIEGGRTRTGRAIIPKGGLLSVIVDSLQTGDIEDAYIVPASFNYERIVDGDYTQEQMGLPKVDESFFGAVKAILRVLFGNFGSIRVDFARPFSLKEFLNSANNNPNIIQNQMDTDYLEQTSSVLLDSKLSYPNHSMVMLSNQLNGTVNNSRVLVKALADHTVYTADHASTPMSTHLLAFLLLTQYREGGTLEQLASSLQQIIKELQRVNVDVGFCGKASDVIVYAQRLLNDQLVSRTLKSNGEAYVFRPNLSIPDVFELSYYASFVSTHFAVDSIIACALMHESNLSLFQLLSKSILPDTMVVKERVLDIAEQLCCLLHTEFIFVPPCTNLENSLSDLLQSFVSKEILKEEKNEWDEYNERDRQMANRIAKTFDIEEEDEEEYDTVPVVESLQLNINHSEVRHQLHFLVSVLGPILESHLNVINFVMENLIDEMADKEFFHELGVFTRSRVVKGMSIFSESCAMLNLRLAVKSLQDQKLVYSYSSAGLVMIGVCDGVNIKDRLEKYALILKGVLS